MYTYSIPSRLWLLFLCTAVLSCLRMTSAYLLCICSIHRQSRRKLNHTDGYNDQWCLTEGDNSNCAWPSLAANRSMPACPQNVKWQLMEGLERQTRMRLFPKWILQKPVVFFPTQMIVSIPPQTGEWATATSQETVLKGDRCSSETKETVHTLLCVSGHSG